MFAKLSHVMKIFSYFFFMLCVCITQAADDNGTGKVYLLTSLVTPPSILRSKDYIEKDTEKVFKAAFRDSGYKSIVKHKVNQVELQKILTDNQTRGVFWVSHANKQQDVSQVGVLGAEANITDVNGLNAKHIFQDLNPNIKFLGLVGCRASEIFKGFSYEENKDLTIFSFDDKTTAKAGLIKALHASIKSLGDGSISQKDHIIPQIKAGANNIAIQAPVCGHKKGIEIGVKRIIKKNESINAVKILLNKSIMLGHFPHAVAPADSDLIQETNIYLPESIFKNKDDLSISVETMEAIEKGYQNYGEIIFGDNHYWELFTRKNGQAVGGRDHLYFFVGNLDEINNTEKARYQKYQCVDLL